jgi:hypothetical protein
MQNMRAFGRMLRLSGSYADYLADGYWDYIYELHTREYKTSACQDGGSLDQKPGDSAWP